MDNKDWEDIMCFEDDINAQDKRLKGKVRKRKWREIEDIKEQRRLRRDIASYEQYSY
jgi:hypothetical protein